MVFKGSIKKPNMKKIIVLFLLAMSVNYGLQAQKPAVVLSDKTGWHKIGSTTVDFVKDHDEVDVLLADKFASLKFKVLDAPIDLRDIDVYFKDGGKQTITVGFEFKVPGESSREIDISGPGERKLDKIVFRYRTLPNRQDKKATVEIWGRKTNEDKKADTK